MMWRRFCGQVSGRVFVPKGRMILAWQFSAWNGARDDPSRRLRCDAYYRLAQDWRMRLRGPMENLYPILPRVTAHTVPYGTDLFLAVYPGSKLPGYHHSVPSGQKSDTCPHSRVHSNAENQGRVRVRFRRLSAAWSAIRRCAYRPFHSQV